MSKHELIVFLSALGVRLIVFVLILSFYGADFFYSSDINYLPLARNIWEKKIFSENTSPPYLPEFTNTPGYPLFLALTVVPFGTAIPSVMIQTFLMSFSGVILLRTLKHVFSPKVSLGGAFLFILEPWNVYISNQLLTESFFMFLFLLGIYNLMISVSEPKFKNILIGGIGLSVATFVRPITLYFLPLAVLFFVMAWHKKIKNNFKFILVLVLSLYSFIIPWCLRNYIKGGEFILSTKGIYTFYKYDLEQFLVYSRDITVEDADKYLLKTAQKYSPAIGSYKDLYQPQYTPVLARASLEIIGSAPRSYFKARAVSFVTFFVSDGYRLLLRDLKLISDPLPNLSRFIFEGDYFSLVSYVKNNLMHAILLIGGIAFWSAAALGFFLALPLAWRLKESRQVKIFIAVSIGITLYFVFLTGLVSQARYRIPVTPFIFALFAYVVFRLKDVELNLSLNPKKL